MSRKERIRELVSELVQDMPRPNKNNVDAKLWEAFAWQTICDYADEQLKACWQELIDDGVIESEAKMKAKDAGDWCAAQGKALQVMVKLSNPSNRFNQELCQQNLVKKFKLKADRVSAIFEGSKKADATGSLKRTVIELLTVEAG